MLNFVSQSLYVGQIDLMYCSQLVPLFYSISSLQKKYFQFIFPQIKMNIKIVYNKKLFKLQSGLSSLAEIRQAILSNSGYKLPNQFGLFVQTDAFSQDLVELVDEQTFEFVRSVYSQYSWPSLKILISDGKDKKQIQQDLDILNSSMTMMQPKTQIQQKMENQTQTDVRQLIDEAVQNTVQQVSQNTQSKPESLNFEQQIKIQNIDRCQTQVLMKDSGQNPSKQDQIGFPCFRCLGSKSKCEECNGSGIHRDNLKLVEVVNSIIDQRLKHYLLIEKQQSLPIWPIEPIQPQIQPQIQKPEIFVIQFNKIIEVSPNAIFEFEVRLKNKGATNLPEDFQLVTTSETFKNVRHKVSYLYYHWEFNSIVEPNQEYVAKIQYKAPEKPGNQCIELRFQYDKGKQLDEKVFFILKVKPEDLEFGKVQEKAKKIQELFPTENLANLMAFIRMSGSDKSVDQLTELFLNQL